jgi:hypothetical protein
MVRDADLYQQALVVRHLNPYRRPLSFRQKAALMSITDNRRGESVEKAVKRVVVTPLVRKSAR